MIEFIHHWLYEDLWVPVWPNWAAGAVVGVLGYAWGKKELLKLHTKLDNNRAELKAHQVKVEKHLGLRK